jgi:uncharacterized protein with beta-barrel porin domain
LCLKTLAKIVKFAKSLYEPVEHACSNTLLFDRLTRIYQDSQNVNSPETRNSGWIRNNADGTGSLSGSSTTVDSVQLTAYGTRRFGPAFVDAMAGVGYNMYDQSRFISFMDEKATAKYDGFQFMGKLDGGWDFNLDRVILTPDAGFQAIYAVNRGYSEEGAGIADVSVGHQSVDSYTTTLGGKIATTMPTQWGKLTPEFKLAWAHDFANGPIITSANMGGVSFTTATPRAAPDGAQITLATTLNRSDDFSIRFEYNGDLRADYGSHAGLVKGLWNF